MEVSVILDLLLLSINNSTISGFIRLYTINGRKMDINRLDRVLKRYGKLIFNNTPMLGVPERPGTSCNMRSDWEMRSRRNVRLLVLSVPVRDRKDQ